MSLGNIEDTSTCAKVIAQGKGLSLLVEAPILGSQKACRVRVILDGSVYNGLGISLDTSTVLLVINAPTLSANYKVGSTLALYGIRVMGTNMAFERVRERLRSLLNVESLGPLSDRAARHALLYILEARDPEVRYQRLEFLKATLLLGEGSERQHDTNI